MNDIRFLGRTCAAYVIIIAGVLFFSLTASAEDAWNLWSGETMLRGANIHQRRVYPELDGTEYLGGGPIGPPFTQADFDRLSALGANYVNISHPGLFTETPPFEPDPAAVENLDRLVEMAEKADLFVVISFRTGPGRSEFTFYYGDEGWFPASYINNSVWDDPEAQRGWAEMWRYTAERYRDNPVIAGLDLMVEPNINEVYDIWEPEEFYARFTDTSADWNRMYPPIVSAIREVDPKVPILVGGMSYSAVEWLPWLVPVDDPRIVYTVHQYAPYEYTHQGKRKHISYPGSLDTDWDGTKDAFDREWIDALMDTVRRYQSDHGVEVAVNEFGVVRWVPGGATFLTDQMDVFESMGMNHAIWAWHAVWKPYADNDAFNFLFGPDSSRHTEVPGNELISVISSFWDKNDVRPSSFR